MTLVVDASVAVKWLIPEVQSEMAGRLLDQETRFIVPDLIFSEIGNVLWKKVNRSQLSLEAAFEIAKTFRKAPLTVQRSEPLMEEALELAVRTGLTFYDSLYLALAIAEDCQLVTADKRFLERLRSSPLRPYVRWVEDGI